MTMSFGCQEIPDSSIQAVNLTPKLASASGPGSCQRPTGKAFERDEEGIRHWLKYRWPQVKKKSAQR